MFLFVRYMRKKALKEGFSAREAAFSWIFLNPYVVTLPGVAKL
jgi:hypothetical protein